MAAFVAATSGGGSGSTGNRSVTVTTAVSGNLIVVFVVVSANTNDTPTCSDNHADGLGTYTLIRKQNWSQSGADGDRMACFVRDALLGSTDTSFVITAATGSNTAGEVGAIEVSGMSLTG